MYLLFANLLNRIHHRLKSFFKIFRHFAVFLSSGQVHFVFLIILEMYIKLHWSPVGHHLVSTYVCVCKVSQFKLHINIKSLKSKEPSIDVCSKIMEIRARV